MALAHANWSRFKKSAVNLQTRARRRHSLSLCDAKCFCAHRPWLRCWGRWSCKEANRSVCRLACLIGMDGGVAGDVFRFFSRGRHDTDPRAAVNGNPNSNPHLPSTPPRHFAPTLLHHTSLRLPLSLPLPHVSSIYSAALRSFGIQRRITFVYLQALFPPVHSVSSARPRRLPPLLRESPLFVPQPPSVRHRCPPCRPSNLLFVPGAARLHAGEDRAREGGMRTDAQLAPARCLPFLHADRSATCWIIGAAMARTSSWEIIYSHVLLRGPPPAGSVRVS